MTEPWEHEDGSTNVEGFLEAYRERYSIIWHVEIGHLVNVVDELIDRLEERDEKESDQAGPESGALEVGQGPGEGDVGHDERVRLRTVTVRRKVARVTDRAAAVGEPRPGPAQPTGTGGAVRDDG